MIMNEKEQQKIWGPIFLDEDDDDENETKRKELIARLRKKAIEADNQNEWISLAGLTDKQIVQALGG